MKDDLKICIYLEFNHIAGGALFKNIGTGLLSSYRNQKKMLENMGIAYVEKWDASADILQINTPWLYSLWLMRKAKRLGIPVIVWAHVTAEDIRGVFWFGDLISPFMRKYLAYAYDQADVVLCVSDYTRGLVHGYGIAPTKTVTQSNGVDLSKFYRDAQKREEWRNAFGLSGTVAGTVALAIPRKGIDTFVSLAKALPGISFLWVGKIYSGALVKPLPKDLSGNARFLGFVPDVLAAFNAFDLFVFPSFEENQGMVLLEAAALGLPIVVRDIPVYAGWLRHGENCLKASTDEEFEQHVAQLAADPDLAARLGAEARLLAEENSLEVLSHKMRSLYGELTTAPDGKALSSSVSIGGAV